MAILVEPAFAPTTSAPDGVVTTDPGATRTVSLHGVFDVVAADADVPDISDKPVNNNTDAAPSDTNDLKIVRILVGPPRPMEKGLTSRQLSCEAPDVLSDDEDAGS